MSSKTESVTEAQEIIYEQEVKRKATEALHTLLRSFSQEEYTQREADIALRTLIEATMGLVGDEIAQLYALADCEINGTPNRTWR